MVSWPCGDSEECGESFHMQLCLMDHLFAHVPHRGTLVWFSLWLCCSSEQGH